MIFDDAEKIMPKIGILKSIAASLPRSVAESFGITNSSDHASIENPGSRKVSGYLQVPIVTKPEVQSAVLNLHYLDLLDQLGTNIIKATKQIRKVPTHSKSV